MIMDIGYSFADQRTLNVLRSVLEKYKIPLSLYSLYGYSEDRACIENSGVTWIVYLGSHGKRYDVKKYTNLHSACVGLLDFLAEDKASLSKMKHDFLQAYHIDPSIRDEHKAFRRSSYGISVTIAPEKVPSQQKPRYSCKRAKVKKSFIE